MRRRTVGVQLVAISLQLYYPFTGGDGEQKLQRPLFLRHHKVGELIRGAQTATFCAHVRTGVRVRARTWVRSVVLLGWVPLS